MQWQYLMIIWYVSSEIKRILKIVSERTKSIWIKF